MLSASRSTGGRWSALAALLLGLLTLAAVPAHAEPLAEVSACPPPAASPSSTGPILACVGSFSITRSTFDHWMQVAADGTGQDKGKKVVPDRPPYAACISHLSAEAKQKHSGPAPTRAKLKKHCEREYRTLRGETLGFLLSSAWVLQEARELKVEVSEAEAQQNFVQLRKQQFPKPGEFKAFLRQSGETVADLILRVRLNLLSKRLQAHVLAAAQTPEAKEQALVAFVKAFATRWKGETYCLATFAVSDCGHVVDSL
jgi:hypothetical protein